MLEKTVFSTPLPYRDNLEVKAFLFGMDDQGCKLGDELGIGDIKGFEKAICVVGGIRGDEVQQTFICANLVHKLRRIEERGNLVPNKLIAVVPCVNTASMNIRKRFWVGDNTDVNRMMPGYDKGETTQRIAAGVFEEGQGFSYGVHLSSYYLEGNYLPHARIMVGVGLQDNHGADFGLPYVLRHVPGSFDTTTLHYNWRLWDTEAYTLYTMETKTLDYEAADLMDRALLRFMNNRGIIDYPGHGGFLSTEFSEQALVPVQAGCGGFFRSLVKLGDIVAGGDVIAQVMDPLRGEVKESITAPNGGVIFFECRTPLVYEDTLAFQIVPRSVNKLDADEVRGNFLDPEA